jgi:hypothetical protein
MKMITRLSIAFCLLTLVSTVSAQGGNPPPLLPDSEAFLLTVFLKHDQTMNNDERRVLLDNTGWDDMFPPEGVEIVSHYVMMGIGQVIVMRVPPERLRLLNIAIERGAWGAYQTEFYVTYDLAAARAAQAAASQ